MLKQHSYRSTEDSCSQVQCGLVSGVANPVKLTSPDSTSEHENFIKYVLEFENVLMDGMLLTD